MSDISDDGTGSDTSIDTDVPTLTPGMEIEWYSGTAIWGDARWLRRGDIREIKGKSSKVKITMDTHEVIRCFKLVCPVYNGIPSGWWWWDLRKVHLDRRGVVVNAPNPNAQIVDNMREGMRDSLNANGMGQFAGFIDAPNSSNNPSDSIDKHSDSSSSDESSVETNSCQDEIDESIPRNETTTSDNESNNNVGRDDSSVESYQALANESNNNVGSDDSSRESNEAVSGNSPSPTSDLLTSAIICYNFMMNCAISFILMSHIQQNASRGSIPRDVIQVMVEDVIERNGLKGFGKRLKRGHDSSAKKKRVTVSYNRARAQKAVTCDWMSPTPIFNDRQFERTFRIKRFMVDNIINHLVKHDSFWTQTIDAVGNLSIHPHVKFLAAQKIMCYGVSFSAFHDYFQMGESTASLCVSKLSRGIVECPEIAEVYLRTPTKSDAKRIVGMHKELHGIDGMLGSLDVTKVVWENCPAALKGQYQGKEKVATIGLEAVSDANLWIWHRVFGFPGTLNDINIFERSPGHTFQKLYYLVDGIYPWLTRFLATISDPKTKIASYFATR